MALISPVEMPDEDKLETLRRLDQFRWWRSVDEKRYCLICGKIITGRQIQAMGGTRGNGPLRVICSTKGCHSNPRAAVRSVHKWQKQPYTDRLKSSVNLRHENVAGFRGVA